jgi:hypothetical protein
MSTNASKLVEWQGPLEYLSLRHLLTEMFLRSRSFRLLIVPQETDVDSINATMLCWCLLQEVSTCDPRVSDCVRESILVHHESPCRCSGSRYDAFDLPLALSRTARSSPCVLQMYITTKVEHDLEQYVGAWATLEVHGQATYADGSRGEFVF